MSKKVILILAVVFLFFWCHFAEASVIINEIMYAPINGGPEWIEIFNSGSDSVDLTDWRFFNSVDDSAPLRLQSGPALLPGGGYAIITSTDDASSFSGTVFSSSQFSLPNDSVKYKTYKAISDSNKQIIDSVTYTTLADASGTGNSLQLINNVWQAATPTPNAQNYSSISSDSDESSGDSSGSNDSSESSGSSDSDDSSSSDTSQPTVISSSSSSSSISSGSGSTVSSSTKNAAQSKVKIVQAPKIKTKILAQNFAFVGVPVQFDSNATGYSNEALFSGRYFWNFGDGDSEAIKANDMTKFIHTFYYEGEYNVALEYYTNLYSQNPDASDKITIDVVPADISISNVGDNEDFFVEISNNTVYDADISGWILLGNGRTFIFPQNTILQSKKKITLSPKITGFSALDKDALKLIDPEGQIIFDYSNPIKTTEDSEKSAAPIKVSMAKSVSNNIAEQNSDEDEIPPTILEAGVVKSGADTDTKNNAIYLIGLFIFLGISASAVYFIRSRNRKIVSKIAGDDFEIIDE